MPVHDGEEDEVTLFSCRAKLFAMDVGGTAWKERGAGVVKVNVHRSCVEMDEWDAKPIPGSFDASQGDEGTEGKPVIAARLIMRQDNTHKLILNTAIIRALKFVEKPGNTGKQFMFTAFDGGKPINMLLRVSELIVSREFIC